MPRPVALDKAHHDEHGDGREQHIPFDARQDHVQRLVEKDMGPEIGKDLAENAECAGNGIRPEEHPGDMYK